jgi:hypothetical protein
MGGSPLRLTEIIPSCMILFYNILGLQYSRERLVEIIHVFDPILLYNILGLRNKRVWIVEINLVFYPVLLYNVLGVQYRRIRLVEIIFVFDRVLQHPWSTVQESTTCRHHTRVCSCSTTSLVYNTAEYGL